jgi:hypothetical protein
MKWRMFLPILAAPLLLHAEDWTTVDGKVFKNVTVVSHDDGYVTILDDSGGGRVMLTELPAPLRARFGFDPAKASAWVAAAEAAEEKDPAARDQNKQPAEAPKPTSQGSAFGDTNAAPTPPGLSPATLIQNGDFSKGDTGWHGDGQTAPAYLANHPVAMADPTVRQGLIVALNPTAWTRIYQAFAGNKGTVYSIKVTYRVSPNAALSKNPADYQDLLKKVQLEGYEHYGQFSGAPGEFFGTVGDSTASNIASEIFSPKLGTGEVQTYEHTYPAIPPFGNPVFALAFPPGSGTVAILSAEVTDR